MVVCRNAGRYYSVANRSDFYHDFLRSLFDAEGYPAFYNNRVECLRYYAIRFGRLPTLNISDESKEDRYIYYYDQKEHAIRSITIREVIMMMYEPENAFEYARKSLTYTCDIFRLFSEEIEKCEIVNIAMGLEKIDLSAYSGDEAINEIQDASLSQLISRAALCDTMYGIDKPQDKIDNKRKAKAKT